VPEERKPEEPAAGGDYREENEKVSGDRIRFHVALNLFSRAEFA
jgi:hypothetical protein